MKTLVLFLCAACAAAFAQEPQPLASFTGAVRQIDSTTLTLARPDQDDLVFSCTHKTHYFDAKSKRTKREAIHAGDRVTVETKLDISLKPEAVNVRLLPPEKP